jgi:hypothetical protein
MSMEIDRRPALGRGTAFASLIAVVACAIASDAGTGTPSELQSRGQDLSARVATLAEQIRLVEPAINQDSPPAVQLAQWRNY